MLTPKFNVDEALVMRSLPALFNLKNADGSESSGEILTEAGFTLLELLITVMVFVVLSVIAVSSYSYLIQKNEEQTIVDELKTAIRYAKIQSIILGHPVVLSPLDASLNWSGGMILSALNKKTNKMELLYQWQWQHPKWNLVWSGARSANKIIFSNNPAQAISNGRFTLMNVYSQKKSVIVLNRLGRVYISSPCR